MPATSAPEGSAPRGAAVLCHGAGSAPRFVREAFTEPLARAGVDLLSAPEDRTGDLDTIVAGIAREARRLRADGHRIAFVGGVSLGAHAAACWAADDALAEDVDGLLLALPAWTAAPDHVAAATAAAADDVAARGVAAVLRGLRADPALAGDWVVAALAADWPGYPAGALVRALRRAASCPGPGPSVLARIPCPVGLVALDDDPLHPASVADRWARLITSAAVEHVARRAPDAGVDLLGAAALRAWRQAAGSTVSGR